MVKKRKLINIFEQTEEKNNFCTYTSYAILLITLIQVFINTFRYTQLNNFISDEQNKIKNISSQNIQETDNKQFNINFDEMKEVCLLIGLENLESMVLNSEIIEVKGSCKSISKLDNLKDRKKINNFNVVKIEKNEDEYNFELSYKLRENS